MTTSKTEDLKDWGAPPAPHGCKIIADKIRNVGPSSDIRGSATSLVVMATRARSAEKV